MRACMCVAWLDTNFKVGPGGGGGGGGLYDYLSVREVCITSMTFIPHPMFTHAHESVLTCHVILDGPHNHQ